LGLILALSGLITRRGLVFSQISAASAQTEDPAVENQQLRHANQQLEAYIQYLLQSMRGLETDVEEAQQALTDAQVREQQAQQALADLQQNQQQTQQNQEALMAAEAQAQQAQTALSEAQAREQQAQAALAATRAAEQRAQQALADVRQQLQTCTTEAAAAKTEADTREQQAQNQLQQCTADAQMALEQAAEQHQQALEARDQDLRAAQDELRSTQQTLAQTQESLQDLRVQRVELEERYKATTAQLDDNARQLQVRTAEVEAENARRMAEQQQQEQLAMRLRGVHDQLVEQLQDEIRAETVMVQQNGDHLLVRMAGRATFAQGKTSMRRQGRMILQKMSRILGVHPDYEIRVEGHADAMPLNAVLREHWGTNWELSTARATYVIHHFRKFGVSPERLVIEGYGPHRPLASNETPEGRTQNRRIEIIMRPSAKS
jgi:chemotaxis protein MotB